MSFSNDEKDYISPGLSKLRASIPRINGASETVTLTIPKNYQFVKASGYPDIRDWFKHIIDSQLAGEPNNCQMETDLAVFAEISFLNGYITECDIQLLFTDSGDLDDYYLGAGAGIYLRLDYDLSYPVNILREPQPHIHVSPGGFPRFGLFSGNGKILGDFFNFVYMNFYYDSWLEWAVRMYLRERSGLFLPKVLECKLAAFDRFHDLNNPGALDIQLVRELVSVCKNKLDTQFPWPIDTRIADFTNFR